MARRVLTAEDLGRMDPSEQDAVFQASVVTDLSEVPTEFLARVRARFVDRIVEPTRNTLGE